MQILPSVYFAQKIRKLAKKNSPLARKLDVKLQLLLNDPRHRSLRLHKLTGEHKDQWSISIDKSNRLLFQYVPDGILLVDIGTHDEVY